VISVRDNPINVSFLILLATFILVLLHFLGVTPD
jgi:hypothetical protein